MRTREQPLTIHDRIGLGLVAGLMTGLILLMLLWIPFLHANTLENTQPGLILIALEWVLGHAPEIVAAAFLLGFATGDKYLFIITEPFMFLLDWLLRIGGR